MNGTDAGEVTLLVSPDFEIKSSYDFDVIVSDANYSDTQSVTLNVNNKPGILTVANGLGFI